jgi:hypothetical protein
MGQISGSSAAFCLPRYLCLVSSQVGLMMETIKKEATPRTWDARADAMNIKLKSHPRYHRLAVTGHKCYDAYRYALSPKAIVLSSEEVKREF